MDIGAQYRRYISYLNEGRVHDLSDFVHEELIYNDEPMTRADYQNYIADDFARIPDLHFDIHQLIVSDNHVASRLRFNCTPEADFRGHAPNGQNISFVEHVFYQFKNGKIRQVWSLLDDRAIHAQMEKEKTN